MTEPHYVRFARALAFAGGVAATTGGCGMATSPNGDAAVADDAAVLSDAYFDCRSCTCGLTADDAGLPICPGSVAVQCSCVAVGPLAPPDLGRAA